MGEKLSDMSEVIYRQVHPQFYEGKKLGSRAFKPNSSDAGLMSADRSTLSSAQAAYEHYTQEMKKSSACVYGLMVEEFAAEEISCSEDPIPGTETTKANPAHCLADYNVHAEKAWKNISQRLRTKAEKRGCQYEP